MTETLAVPLWLVILAGAALLWAILKNILVPSVRWFLKRHIDKAIEDINTKLDIKLPRFELLKRQVLIDRLVYDNEVLQAIKQYEKDNNLPFEVALDKAKQYAKEIIPSLNVVAYFRIGNWLARNFVKLLYRVRIGFSHNKEFKRIEKNSSIVFIMNHRSNIDYILLAYLAVNKVALSFAVGEWARFWPLQQVIRSLGAYFVRRDSNNVFYRKVLSRYVQIATQAGVVQAVYLEGKLSQDGKIGTSKLGLLNYILKAYDPNKGRDIVFIPVGINYDRVLEDRSLLLSLDKSRLRASKWQAFKTTAKFIFHNLGLRLKGRWHRFGYAIVNFGEPLSMREYMKQSPDDFSIEHLAKDLLSKVSELIPVTPVALISYILLKNHPKALLLKDITHHAQTVLNDLNKKAIRVYFPHDNLPYTIEVGIRGLEIRNILIKTQSGYTIAQGQEALVSYYANSISDF